MNIPNEVIQQALDAYRAPRLHVNDTVHDRFIDMGAATQVIAVWARREALQPVISYLNHCRILRVEPTTAGLTNALAEGEQA